LKCWGANGGGATAAPASGDFLSTTPQVTDSPKTYTHISTGNEATCGLSQGNIRCWGSNINGALGINVATTNIAPFTLDPTNTYSLVSVGPGNNSCAISANKLKCWGNNDSGQVGNGTLGTVQTTPLAIDNATSYSQVRMGVFHACGLTTGNALRCWGSNTVGQLGDGTLNESLTPKTITSGTAYLQLSVGYFSSCAITSSNVLKCWGAGDYGVLGNGAVGVYNTPQTIDSGISYSQVSVGEYHACGIVKTTGVLKCWGDNSWGQLGNGTRDFSLLPTVIDSGTAYTSVSAGENHTCGITTAGTLKCWGENSSAQLGVNASNFIPILIGN
jgi:alpha-tubulin suppressor-like RCC1 family protein